MRVSNDITSATDALSLAHAQTLSRVDPWIHLGLGTIAMVCCAVWAVTRSLNAPETFIVTATINDLSEAIPIKAPNGAKVSRLLVRNGDRVSAGQPLVQLEDSDIHRDFEVASRRLTELLITEQRLLAQRDKKAFLPVPVGIDLTDTTTEKVFAEHRNALTKSLTTLSEEKVTLQDMLRRTETEAAEVAKQLAARLKERDLNERELANSQPLFERNYVNRLRFGQLERESIRIGTEIAKLRAESAKIKAARADIEMRLGRTDVDVSQSAVPELDRVRASLIDAQDAKRNLAARLELSKILSPARGVVRGIEMGNVSLNAPTERELMRITSGQDALVVEAIVSSNQAEKVHVGALVTVEFSSSRSGQRYPVRVPLSGVGIASATSSKAIPLNALPIKVLVPLSLISHLASQPRWLADQSATIVFGARVYPTLADVARPLGDGLALAFGVSADRSSTASPE